MIPKTRRCKVKVILEFFQNSIVIKNMVMLIAVLFLFGLSYLSNDRYNKGHSKGYLYAARVMIILAAVLLIVWFF